MVKVVHVGTGNCSHELLITYTHILAIPTICYRISLFTAFCLEIITLHKMVIFKFKESGLYIL